MFFNVFLEVGFFLVLLLAILLVLLFRRTKVKQTLSKEIQKDTPLSLQSLVQKIKSKTTSVQELRANLELVLKHYGNITDFSMYEKIIISIVLHPSTNKNIILFFDTELSKRNPTFKKQISDTVTSTLKLR